MIELIKRFLAGGIVVAGLITALVLVPHVPAGAAEVATVPYAQPGSVVRVTGTADSLGIERIRLCWDEPGCSNLGSVRLPVLQTSYSTEVTIPATALAGMHVIYACTSLSCASAAIEVALAVETSTTTAATAPTTAPDRTTTTLPPPTTTSTTRSVSTPGPETTTTVGGEEATSSIVANVANDDLSPVGVAIQATPTTGDPSPHSEQAEDSASIPTTSMPTTSISTIRYTPPSTTQPRSGVPRTAWESGDSSAVIEVAAEDQERLSYHPRLVLWTLWLLVVVVASCLVSGIWWLAGRRRRAE